MKLKLMKVKFKKLKLKKLKIKEIKFCRKNCQNRSQWVGSRDVNEVFQQPNLLTFVFENEFEWSTTR